MEPRREYRALLVVGAVCLIFVQLGLMGVEIPVALEGRTDFRHFYAAGFLVRTGHGSEIYDYERTIATEKEVAGRKGPDLPYTHPAYEALVFAVLSKLPYKTAFWIYLGISVGLLALTLRWLMPNAAWMTRLGEARASTKSHASDYKKQARWLGPTLLAAGFLPVGICLIQGQDSIALLALIAASCVLQKSGRDFAAGAVLGLAAFRFQFLPPVAVLLLFQKRWKFLGGAAVSCAAAIAVSLAVAGPESLTAYPRYLAAMSVGLHTTAQKTAMGVWPATMPNLRGLVSVLQLEQLRPWLAQALTAAASLGLLAWAAVKRLRFELMAVAAVLLSYHGDIHDSVLLLLPLLTLQVAAEKTWSFWMWVAMVVLPSVAFVARVPFAALAAVYVVYLLVMAESAAGRRQEVTAPVTAAG